MDCWRDPSIVNIDKSEQSSLYRGMNAADSTSRRRSTTMLILRDIKPSDTQTCDRGMLLSFQQWLHGRPTRLRPRPQAR